MLEQHAVLADFLLVGIQEQRHQRITFDYIELREGHGQHRPRTLRHLRADLRQRHRWHAVRSTQAVGGSQHVRRTVQQRAIQVEQGSTREPGKGHAGLLALAR